MYHTFQSTNILKICLQGYIKGEFHASVYFQETFLDAQGRSQGGLWGLETPLQSVSYSKVNASINYFTGAV